MVFQLCYIQHGGSGLGWEPSAVLDLPLGRATWYLDRLWQERKAESDAMKKASKGKG